MNENLFLGKPPSSLVCSIKNKISFLYLEYGIICRENNSLLFKQGINEYDLPVGVVSSLLLGPGCSITQPAMIEISRWGCSVSFTNKDGLGLLASYLATTASSARNSILQAQIVSDSRKRLQVARKMFAFRWGAENVPKSYSLKELMMLEGRRVQKAYNAQAEKYELFFIRKNRPDFDVKEYNVNHFLTSANHILYGVVSNVVQVLGFSPRLGVVHNGQANSFVYDIADLYKEKIIIPLCFELFSQGEGLGILRSAMRERLLDYRFMPTIVDDIYSIFDIGSEDDKEAVSSLWTPDGIIDNAGVRLGINE